MDIDAGNTSVDMMLTQRFIELVDNNKISEACQLCTEDVMYVSYERGACQGRSSVEVYLTDMQRFSHHHKTFDRLQFVRNSVDDEFDLGEVEEDGETGRPKDTMKHLAKSLTPRRTPGLKNELVGPGAEPGSFLNASPRTGAQRGYSVLEREGRVAKSMHYIDYRYVRVKETYIVVNHKLHLIVRQRRFA